MGALTSRSRAEPSRFHFYRGRVALYALLRALGIGPGAEVVLQAFTCLAVPAPVVGLGARPVYVDVTRETYNLDPTRLEAALSPATRAIVVQHTFGMPADLDPILEIARPRRLPVIEDCCHALGARYRGSEVGSFGAAAFYSYEFGKPVVIGLGGVAVCNEAELTSRVRSLYGGFKPPPRRPELLVNLQYYGHAVLRRPRLFWQLRQVYHRLARGGWLVGTFTVSDMAGRLGEDYEWRMPESCRRRLMKKLQGIDATIAHRRRVARRYEDGIRGLGIACPVPPKAADPVYLRYPILARDKAAVLAEARRRRMELGDWFVSPVDPLDEGQWSAVGYERGTCPVAEEMARRVVTLPVYERIDRAATETTVEFLRDMRERELI